MENGTFWEPASPEEKLDRGWFTGPAGQALLIHSRTFGDYAAGKREEVIGRDGAVVCHNVTASYTKTRKLRIQVRKQDNTPAAHAQVSVEILNMAEYFPAAVLETRRTGRDFDQAWAGRYPAAGAVRGKVCGALL